MSLRYDDSRGTELAWNCDRVFGDFPDDWREEAWRSERRFSGYDDSDERDGIFLSHYIRLRPVW